ncbi:MAG: C45 family autoproteolytic acyltransferase/hydrolase [Lentisphaerales bacterium]|nr:C45 family autoproteolytic acyltransferase/hydrolase [Lentisphaerales bacterium]
MKYLGHLLIFLGLYLTSCVTEVPKDATNFYKAFESFTANLKERGKSPFTYHIDYKLQQEEKGEIKKRSGHLKYVRISENKFSIAFKYHYFKMQLTRNNDELFMYIPHSETLFIDSKSGNKNDLSFSLENSIATALNMEPELQKWLDLPQLLGSTSLKTLVQKLSLTVKPLPSTYKYESYAIQKGKHEVAICKISRDSGELAEICIKTEKSCLKLRPQVFKYAKLLPKPADFQITKTINVDKHELHKSLTRGLARLAEVKFWEAQPQSKENFVRKGKHGYYKMLDGRRLIKLKGNSYEIGWQHGQFLPKEIRRTTDSTLYLVGLVYSVKKGRWFLDDIRGALKRLDKFTPPEYLEEIKGVADGSGIDRESIHLANYFPALFHCSGFAIKDSATKNGTLYHGRILDYMCTVGLQNNAAIFAVEKEDKIPFVNIGFASFIGSVSGINQKKISLGEMGGRGEGDWDGVTMPILMRMALENGHTLEDVKKIFSENPRTCEYYYVFTDGKDKSAVGVYALPDKIEFVDYAQKHEKLKYSLPDCILLSGGERYEHLHGKAKKNFSKIDEKGAIDLMNAPVAMDSNLHSVLFIPEKLKFLVANAGPGGAAYKQQFYSYLLNDLLNDGWYE